MASKTIIDQLIVKLGLDPTEFSKGQKKAAAELVDFKNEAEKTSSSVGSSLVSLGAKFLTLGAIIYGLKKVFGIVSDTATITRQLGIDAKNFGMAADEMRNWQNAVEMAGGKAADFTATMGNFQKAIFDLTYNGAISDSLVMLARLGVQFQDSRGRARGFNDVVLDTADALEKAQKSGHMTRESAYQYAIAAGFDPGTANLLLQGRAGVQKELASRRENVHQVNETDLGAAEKVRRKIIGGEQKLAGGEVVATSVAELSAEKAADLYTVAVNKTSDAMTSLTNAVTGAASSITRFFEQGAPGRIPVNNPGNLRPPGQSTGFMQYPTPAAGVRAMNHQLDLYKSRGINTIDSIINKYAPKSENNTEAYKRDLERQTGIKRGTQLTAADRENLISAMTKHEHTMPLSSWQVHNALAGRSINDSGTTGGGAGKTEVHIDTINVNTQATDAKGIVRDMDSETKRKMLASFGTNQGQS